MPITDEQKESRNEMRRLNRTRKKVVVPQEEQEEIKEEPEEIKEESKENKEEPEEIRKKVIADKRRASLALARSKIKLNLQITKEKDVELIKIKEENLQLKELTKIKEENLQLKELANKKEEVPKIVKKPVKVYNTPIKQRPKKEEVYQQPQQVQQQVQQPQQPSMEYLVDKSYAEQLANKLKQNMYQRMMQDTFM